MTDFLLDLRLAARTLLRAPRFAALAIATLALGIGGTTTLFSLVDAVLLKALPFREPDRLMEVFAAEGTRTTMRVPGPVVEALRARASTLEGITLHGPVGGVLAAPEGAVQVFGDRVSASFLDVMGVAPLAGRGFLPDEERPGAAAVLLVSFAFWQQHLGGDPQAVGRTIVLDTTPHTIVGIMPPTFRTQFRSTPGYWTMSVPEPTRELERTIGYELYARLAPGVTLDAARREVQAIAASVALDTDISARDAWRDGRRRLTLLPLKDDIVRDSAYALQLLLAAVAVVLAIACANLAQLLLARSDRRVGEFAIRQALGASSPRLFRLALLESLLLSAAGGIAGVVLARWLMPVLLALAPEGIPRLGEAAIDGRVLALALGLSGLTGCAFGVAPALRLSRLSVLQAMKRAPNRGGRARAPFQSALVVIQVASSVALLALAGLVGRTFLTLLPSNPGFAAESRTVFTLMVRYATYEAPERRRQVVDTFVERLRTLPGVSDVAVASNVPFSDEEIERVVRRVDDSGGVTIDDRGAPRADLREVSTNFFQMFQLPVRRGRIFTPADRAGSTPVAIVNESLARRLAPGGDVLGRRIQIVRSTNPPPYEIVGVVADARSTGTSVDTMNEVYVPYAQSPSSLVHLIVRSPMPSAQLTPLIRDVIRAAAPGLPLRTDNAAIAMDDLIRQSLARPRFSATLMSAFSATALLLSTIGLFGLVAYSVTQRYHELGIRAALGARPQDLLVTTVRSVVALTALGIAIGLTIGAWLTRFIAGQLYAIAPLDGPTFAGAAILMLTAAALAAFIPARRAMRTNPLTVLRHE